MRAAKPEGFSVAETAVSPGGASTINGVLYQMLWSLLRTVRLHLIDFGVDKESGKLLRVTLTLEPAGGGGDLQQVGHATKIVEQLKARPDGGAWSLREVVEDVLPDLYVAADIYAPNAQYRFVTEGHMGDWEKCYLFFRSLGTRTYPAGDVLAGLDDTQQVRFRRSTRSVSPVGAEKDPFWPDAIYTERTLFNRIVEEIRKRKSVCQKEVPEATQRNLWHLLGRFMFVGDQTEALIKKQIDDLLLTVVDTNSGLADKRDAMLIGLSRRARQGNAEIVASEFLATHGLDATPLSHWLTLVGRSSARLGRELQRRGYHPIDDVRLSAVEAANARWAGNQPLLVLSGQSGLGKSWLLQALADNVSGNEVVVLVNATGDATLDMSAAADAFWQDIAQHDAPLSLNRIGARLRDLTHVRARRWLFLFIDGIQDPLEARILAQQPWEDWGVRLAVSCLPEVAHTFKQVGADRVVVHDVVKFTDKELREYLERRGGISWHDIPSGVRLTLQTPLLARLYRDVAAGAQWRPTNEYELYSRYWQRLESNEEVLYPLDSVHLRQLARAILNGATYPWTGEVLIQFGLDNAAIIRLIRLGWLRAGGGGRYEVWHDRLLNWAVAEGLVAACASRDVTAEALGEQVSHLLWSNATYNGRMLGYVPMDVIWLLANPETGQPETLDKVVAAMESDVWGRNTVLYEHLLPTAGVRVIAILFRRLANSTGESSWERRQSIVRAIKLFKGADVAPYAIQLLAASSVDLLNASFSILAHCPSPDALERLWTVHRDIRNDPSRYRDTAFDRSSFADLIGHSSFLALSACAKLNPDWLEAAIMRADPATQPVHDLAYCLADMDGEARRWMRCKPALKTMLGIAHERSLAMNIHKHRDASEVAWLETCISRADDIVGAAAMQALIRIDTERALMRLAELPLDDLVSTRHWCFGALLARRPADTLASLLEILRCQRDPWEVAAVFDGRENAMDVPILALLLDALAALIDSELEAPDTQGNNLYNPLRLLAKVQRLELLDCFKERQGTILEDKLTAWVLGRGGYRGYFAEPDLDYAVQVLYKIGGRGFTQAINAFLGADNHYSRLAGSELAAKRPDERTVELLVAISLTDKIDQSSGFPYEQSKAATALGLLHYWQHVVAYLLKWGLEIDETLLGARTALTPLDDVVMAPVLVAFQAGLDPPVGAVLALGLGQRSDQIHRIVSTLDSAPEGSVLGRGCLISLSFLNDPDNTALASLRRQLRLPACRHDAVNALLKNGSDSALDVLLGHLKIGFDLEIAVNLLFRPRTNQEAAQMVRSELNRLSALAVSDPMALNAFSDMLQKVLLYVDDKAVLAPILEAEEIRRYLAEGAFAAEDGIWHTGSKAAIIRGLAALDEEEALLATQRALLSPDSHDREYYPYLLLELDASRGSSILLEQAAKETSTKVIRAMSRALAWYELRDTLLSWINSAEAGKRWAACRLAGCQSPSDEFCSAIRTRLNDDDERVVEAASEAINRLEDTIQAHVLLAAFEGEQSLERRFVLLDALIEVADPGDAFRPWPIWAVGAAKDMPYLMQVYLMEKVGDRRKKLGAQAEERDRQFGL